MFRLPQTMPDYLGTLSQVGGYAFDCAGPGSTDWVRMACKRPGVRVPLAPLHDVPRRSSATLMSHHRAVGVDYFVL
jgi:hypothetical protein